MIQEDIHHAGMFAEVATFENAPFEIASPAELMKFAGIAWSGGSNLPGNRRPTRRIPVETECEMTSGYATDAEYR